MKKIILLLMVVLLAGAAEMRAGERLENYTNKTVLVFTPHPDDGTFASRAGWERRRPGFERGVGTGKESWP